MWRVPDQRERLCAASKRVHRADDAHRPLVEHIRVDHGCFDVGMAEQRLNGADVLSGLEKVRREAVPEAVRCEADGQTCPSNRFPYGALNPLLIKMVTPDMPAAGIGRIAVGGKNILLTPFKRCARIFSG